MDAKQLAKWRVLAQASTAGLDWESYRSHCEISDGESSFATTETSNDDDKANARFWCQARGIVLALIGEVERLDGELEAELEEHAETLAALKACEYDSEIRARAEDHAEAKRKGEV